MRTLSNERSETRVVSGRFVLSCIVSLACLIGLLGWADAAPPALLSFCATRHGNMVCHSGLARRTLHRASASVQKQLDGSGRAQSTGVEQVSSVAASYAITHLPSW